MKLLSIEPTPSPNSMKLTLDEKLPDGVRKTYTDENKQDAPAYIQKILEIEGVKSLFQVADFIALDRKPGHDWQDILYQVRIIFGEDDGGIRKVSPLSGSPSGAGQEAHVPGEVKVYVQQFREIPMQIKLLAGGQEYRIGLPEHFQKAVMKAQEAADNLILERKWVEQGSRYGLPDEVGEQVVMELEAAYSEERLTRLVNRALDQFGSEEPVEKEDLSHEKIKRMLDDPDWKVRYAALQQMKPEVKSLSLLQKALQDEHISVRRLAVAYLGEIEDSKVLPLLFEALKDSSFIIRRTAGDALSDLGDPQAIGPMCDALKDKNKLVRWRAAMFLYEVGDESALPALHEAKDDPEFEVQMQVKMAIERIEGGEEAEGSVWKQMTRAVSHSDSSRHQE